MSFFTGRPDSRVHWPKSVAVTNRRVLDHFAAPFLAVSAADARLLRLRASRLGHALAGHAG